jgi:hypothetical protein
MVSSLLVLAVLQLSSPSDVPRLTVPPPPAYSLLAPVSGPVGSQGRLLDQEETPEGAPSSEPVGLSPGDMGRSVGGLFAGFGLQLLVGSVFWLVETVVVSGLIISGAHDLARSSARLGLFLNATILPILSALPVFAIAQGNPDYEYNFLVTWVAGLVVYGGLFTVADLSVARADALMHYGLHAASWGLTALVQVIVVQATRELKRPRFQGAALLNVEGPRVSWGAPVPALMPDRARPGQLVASVLLAQGRF